LHSVTAQLKVLATVRAALGAGGRLGDEVAEVELAALLLARRMRNWLALSSMTHWA